jgi:hypothetical protein
LRTLALVVFGGLLCATVASAQPVQLQSTARDSAVTLLRDVLDRNDYLLVDRDTLLRPEEVVDRDLLLMDARLTVEGRITGSVIVVNGELFVRPRARIGGRVAVLGVGGAFISGLAASERAVYNDPRNSVEVVRSSDAVTVRVLPPPRPSVLRFPNIIGVDLPTYDRVNGLSLSWGPELRLGGRDTAVLTIRPTIGFRAARETIDGGVDVRLRPTARTMILARAARLTRTPDAWIRGPLPNSISSFLFQSDTRDYFESDEVSLTFARTPPPPLIEGERFLAPSLTLRASRDRSLAASDPWSLFTDDEGWRTNPSIDDGELVSVIVAAAAGWQGAASSFYGAVATEWAPPGIGDAEFAQLSLTASYGMQALWNHQIAVGGYLLHPLGPNEAPLQRWSHVGGSGTLVTYPDAAMRGDHVLFLESVYLAPLPRIRLPLVGEPSLRLEHTVGAAWRTGDEVPLFGQNLGVGVQAGIFSAMLITDPTVDDPGFKLKLGAQMPGGGGGATGGYASF